MAVQYDWDKIKLAWCEERTNTGCSIAQFAKKHHLALGSCKRHLTVKMANDFAAKNSNSPPSPQKNPRPRNLNRKKRTPRNDPSARGKSGGQKGNQNARKHGSYSKLIDERFLAMASDTGHEHDYTMARAHMLEAIAYRQELFTQFMPLVERLSDEEKPLTDLEYDAYHALKRDINNADKLIRDWKMTQDYHLKMIADNSHKAADTRLKNLAGDKLEIETGSGFSVDEILARMETEESE